MKKYLHLTITQETGSTFTMKLKLSEVALISTLSQEYRSVLVVLEKCTKEQYKIIFG
jgi:hypothetical protein